jgi:adenylate kinase
MHPLRVVLLGPPASGKGTQGRLLAESLGLGYLGTGALLREQMEQGTELGKLAAPLLARGEYLPDDLMSPLLGAWICEQTGGWVLDGFPRSLPQAVFLDELLAEQGRELDFAISLEVPYADLVTRMKGRLECAECRWTGQSPLTVRMANCPLCGGTVGRRADDDEENFRSRYDGFMNFTQPVIAHYRKQGLLSPCDATAPQDQVAARLLRLFPAPSFEKFLS